MLDLLAADALPLAGADAVGEGVHAVEDLVDVGHDVLAVDDERALVGGGAAQRGVEDGAVLGGVEVLAGEHGVAALLELDGAAEVAQKLDGLVVDQVLGKIKVQVVHIEGELGDAVGIGGELLLEAKMRLDVGGVVGKGLPLGGLRSVDRCGDGCHVRVLPGSQNPRTVLFYA